MDGRIEIAAVKVIHPGLGSLGGFKVGQKVEVVADEPHTRAKAGMKGIVIDLYEDCDGILRATIQHGRGFYDSAISSLANLRKATFPVMLVEI